MKRRFVAVVIVIWAVLFCQSGGVVLAAICPHLRATHETCHGMIAVVAPHEMQHANGDAFETSDTGAACNHCVIHASNKRDDTALREANSAQRANDLTVSITLATANLTPTLKAVAWRAKAHGPPYNTGPLSVLINVFRI